MNLGAFAVVCALPHARTLADYTGLRRHRPWLAVSLVVCLLGLIGTPPTGVFAGKLTVFTAALDARLGWLAVIAAINTVASVFYYLRGSLRHCAPIRHSPSRTAPPPSPPTSPHRCPSPSACSPVRHSPLPGSSPPNLKGAHATPGPAHSLRRAREVTGTARRHIELDRLPDLHGRPRRRREDAGLSDTAIAMARDATETDQWGGGTARLRRAEEPTVAVSTT
ncbi:proton-conducting transporter membrane subunit [Actinophytocola sp.]|uniref:proton-conducting transporter transmembrane domain-containing protein n=1 Tax=Actinophytocola sp. TaxID=1872138 RepID=UPI003899D13D